ncbi:MAG TPA: Tat proofreading chaperone DmsD, partial [Pasteurellaceae bacterium]|nr:Tat proofreading chaperone DmsD [Pasteurellaceae bacterium]
AENRPELLPEYLAEHLLTWADHYLQLLAEQQDYPFYRGLALLTRQTLQNWQQQAAINVPIVPFYR